MARANRSSSRSSSRSGGRSSRRRSSTIQLDLSGVEARVLVPEDEYLVKVHEVTEQEGDKAPYLAWQFKIADGKYEGQTLYNNTSLSEQSLWNLRALLEALGVEIPEETFDLDLEEMKDLELMVAVEHETYEGKKKARIVDFWPAEDTKPSRSRGKDDDDDRGSRRRSRDDDDGESDRRSSRSRDDDRGSSRSRSRSSKKKGVTQDDINGMDQDELTDLVDELELDVDLKKFKTLNKMRAAVIDAAEAAEVLEQDE